MPNQVANVERRTWDKEAYEARAHARAAAAKQNSSNDNKQRPPVVITKKKRNLDDNNDDDNQIEEEFIAAEPGAAGPEKSERAFLRARKSTLNLDSKVGKIEIIAPDASTISSTKPIGDNNNSALEINAANAVTKTGVGWHCKVCDCFLKDSNSYLDHINGRRHQKALGFSMRVERSTIDQVRARMNVIKAEEKEKQKLNNDNQVVDEFISSFEDIVKKKDEDDEKKREERRKRRLDKKKEKEKIVEEEEEDDDEEEEEEVDMAALMGFGSFGSGRKNR